MKKTKLFLVLVFMVTFVLTVGPALAAKKPNVILLVTYDMGWGDPGSYGFDRGVKTPSRDRIAAEGMRFSNWYAEASCTPGLSAI